MARGFAHGDPREDLFAETPPLFAARMGLSLAASTKSSHVDLMALVVGCAFMFAGVDRELYIDFPSADSLYMSGEHVERLRRALYGARDAPMVWHRDRATTVQSFGFCASRLHPGVYWHASRHVDDLLFRGLDEQQDWNRAEVRGTFSASRVRN